MRMLVRSVALTAVAVLAVGPGAASPAATTASTWTVRPGGAVTATAGKTVLTDTKTGASLTCASSDMSGTLRAGSGLAGTGIGTITTAAYRCPTPIFSYHLTPRGLPWHLNVTSYDRATGVTHGTITHLQLAFAIPETFCSAVIAGSGGAASGGTVAVSYSRKTGQLRILTAGGTLHWYQVHNCGGGLIADGDPAALSASYAISPPQAITSP
jgi:hypothetical protein